MFQKLIDKMNAEGLSVTAPCCFQDYLKEVGINKHRTAQYISIDTFTQLDKKLRDNEIMVFRLGQQQNNKTYFALAKVINDWSDYFLTNDNISKSIIEGDYSIDLSKDFEYEIKAFKALPKWTESSCVNAIIRLGLLNDFLELDNLDFKPTPATAQSTATFDFRANKYVGKFQHVKGQIEIDQLFFAERKGKPFYFLIEAKHGQNWNKELAKHKLFYPAIAISKETSGHPIVPIYLNTYIEDDIVHAQITECSPIIYDKELSPVLADLKPVKSTRAYYNV